MKKFIIRSTFFAVIILVLSPMAAVYASSPADSVHFCLPFDYEQWRRDHPRPAAKRLANLNVGEPRAVRMIYFLPNDRPYRADVVQRMKDAIRSIQTFYTEQMRVHEYEDKIFRFETDAQGAPMVHRVDGQHSDSQYLDDTFGSVLQEIESVFDVRENIYLVVIDNRADLIVDQAQDITGIGRASRVTKNGGFALVTGGFSFNTAAHELGHTFGLNHDFQDQAYIMSYGGQGLSRSQLSACHAEFLTAHTYFNPAVSIEAGASPVIELVSSPEYPAEAKSVAIRLKLQDAEGLHQVFLLAKAVRASGDEVWACHNLAGKQDDEVIFEYDGYSPSAADWQKITSLSDKNVHPMRVEAVDLSGNVGVTSFQLSREPSPDERRASTIEIIAGNHQQDAPGNALASSLVVEVRDQYGQPLPDATIQFGVTEGDARLSGRYLVENATSDTNGRVELNLTLGSNPETIVVRVSAPEVPECQPVLFNATAIGTRVAAPLPGDARMWHLPDGAIARLGRGVFGKGDRAVSFSPDGQRVAVASGIGVWLYDLATARALALFPTTRPIHSVAFSTEGTQLASGGENGEINLWDVATGTKSATLIGHRSRVTTVAFSRDGKMLASGSHRGAVNLWDLEIEPSVSIWEFKKEISSLKPVTVAFSPDDAILVAGFGDGLVRLWDVETKENIATLYGHRLGIRSVSFSRDGKTLASGSDDGTVKLWDVARKETIGTLAEHKGPVTSVSFSRDGNTLVSGSNNLDTQVKLWDVTTGTSIATLSGGHTSWTTSVSFSPDGTIVASGSSEDGNVLLWNVATGNATTFPGIGHVDVGNSVAFSKDGKTLASSSEDGTPKLWEVETGRHIKSFGLRLWGIQVVAFSPDGTTLAAGSLDSTIDLWNVVTGEKIVSFRRGKGQILSMAFSSDGTMLAAGDPNGISLWDIASVSAASTTPGGLVFGDRATNHYISTPLGHTEWVWSVAFSPDGKLVASGQGSWDAQVTLWDAATLTRTATLDHTSWVRCLVFSRDGTILAAGFGDRVVALWDVATRERISTIYEGSNVTSMDFSPDRTTLVLGIWDGSVRLWDVATRENIAILEGHTSKVNSVSFSPDGTTLASGSEDGTVLLWDMSSYIAPQVPNPDFDGDGIVGIGDFFLFVDQFGLNEDDAEYDARFDLDGDGIIGIGDFLIFANDFGEETS